MEQKKLNGISKAFNKAYEKYFGSEIFYIRFLPEETIVTKMYNESATKKYDRANKVSFHGSVLFNPTAKQSELAGLKKEATAIVTFVTQSLVDQGIINAGWRERCISDRLEVTDRFGVTKEYSIVEVGEGLQLSNNYIFTNLGVKEIA